MKFALVFAFFIAGCAQSGFAPTGALQAEINPDSVAALQIIPEKTLTAPNPLGKVQLQARSGFSDDSVMRVRLFPVTKSQDFDPIRRSDFITKLTLSNASGLNITQRQSAVFKKLPKITTVKVDFQKKTLTAGPFTESFSGSVEIRPADPVSATEINLPTDHARLVRSGFLKEGHHPAYRGNFQINETRDDISNSSKARASLVNFVNFESYLDSVVPCEIVADTAPREALKAQAIAARTFALRSLISSRCVGTSKDCTDRGWDVDPSTNYQSYIGATAERPSVTSALDEARHQIVTYNNGPILAMFYASSGGRTSAAKQTICRPIAGRRGTRCTEKLDARYPYFTAKRDPYNGSARRFGHGLGLPQVSARNMAAKGFKAEQILSQYYVGTTISELSTRKL